VPEVACSCNSQQEQVSERIEEPNLNYSEWFALAP